MNIQELEQWFAKNQMPQAPILLNPSTQINNVQRFLDSHFYGLKHSTNERMTSPLLDRLLAFKLLIESNL